MEHTHILGKTGTGKSTLAKQRILSDIVRGYGVLFIDAMGRDIDDILNCIPKRRRPHTILFDPSDYEHPMAWNPLEGVPEPVIPYVASSILDSLKAAWRYADMITPTLDQYLYTTVAALIEANDTLVGIKFLLTDDKFRHRLLKRVNDPFIKDFFANYDTLSAKERRDEIRSTLNKINLLLTDARIRNVIGQHKSAFSIDHVLSQGQLLLVRIPEGKLGRQKAAILGSLLLSQLYQSAAAAPPTIPFRVYVDRCDLFAPHTLIDMLGNAEKYNLSLTLIHQYLDQLDDDLRTAVLGNCAEQLVFSVSQSDGEAIHRITGPDNVNLAPHELPPFVAAQFRYGSRIRGDLHVGSEIGRSYANSASDIRTHNRRNRAVPYTTATRAIATRYGLA